MPKSAVVFLVFLLAVFIGTGVDYHNVKSECDRDHGIVVKGGAYLEDTGFSGYVCVEKGMH